MRMRSKLAAGLVLLLAGAAPAAAQMMGGGDGHMGGGGMMGGRMTGMMDMMRGGTHGGATAADCPGMTAEAAAFSDETWPCIGMRTTWSQPSRTSRRIPSPSPPTTIAVAPR